MKRFHVHVGVGNLDEGIAFYSKLFGAEPSVRKPDYAKWMLEDPRLNFAISTRAGGQGVNHLGFQLDSDEELRAMQSRLAEADAGIVEEKEVGCCYARSDKYWVTDPAGVAWETYRTLGSIQTFGDDATHPQSEPERTASPAAASCCKPNPAPAGAAVSAGARNGCCS
ncbi:MAG TPA: ArsI/CadI family heavy metal resistance metalloenzyme [Casimicrobiaceae bacterium]|jgi:catechol 2,3-dioxygenase-like lactoylglutathione lyase family enzyme